jgi:hypothetical protein
MNGLNSFCVYPERKTHTRRANHENRDAISIFIEKLCSPITLGTYCYLFGSGLVFFGFAGRG